jgi:hypothetical protein
MTDELRFVFTEADLRQAFMQMQHCGQADQALGAGRDFEEDHINTWLRVWGGVFQLENTIDRATSEKLALSRHQIALCNEQRKGFGYPPIEIEHDTGLRDDIETDKEPNESVSVQSANIPCTHVSLNDPQCPYHGVDGITLSMCNKEGCSYYKPLNTPCTDISLCCNCSHPVSEHGPNGCKHQYWDTTGCMCIWVPDKGIAVDPLNAPVSSTRCKHTPDVPYSHCKLYPTMVCLGLYREDCRGFEPSGKTLKGAL